MPKHTNMKHARMHARTDIFAKTEWLTLKTSSKVQSVISRSWCFDVHMFSLGVALHLLQQKYADEQMNRQYSMSCNNKHTESEAHSLSLCRLFVSCTLHSFVMSLLLFCVHWAMSPAVIFFYSSFCSPNDLFFCKAPCNWGFYCHYTNKVWHTYFYFTPTL